MNEGQCRRIVHARSRGYCERCCRYDHLTMHHRKKRGQGGPWSPENIVAVCGHGTAGCHGWIESHPNDANAHGWHVRPWQDPHEVPVYHMSSWKILHPDGSMTPSEKPTEN